MKLPFALILSFILYNCSPKKSDTLFISLPPTETGINFSNDITETDSFNIITYEYIYNGAGVAIADFNNDTLPDIFFTGNQVPNRMYLNQGGMTFNDVTDIANVNVKSRWNTGVCVVDINQDGWKDLYVCATTYPNPEDRQNMLFVNQGVNTAGVPVFKESAGEYGINFSGHSLASAFFDYDKDGDLDLYILVNVRLDHLPTNYREKIADGSSPNNDKLFRNEGNGHFTDVTLSAGIRYEGFGLGLSIQDFNNDSWPDIYVSNDYQSDDILYLNKRDGSFQNATEQFISHQSQFSMGNDAADVNNDGLFDLVTLDMLPENSERKKTTIANKSYQTYINNELFHYGYQHVRNMLQLNQGLDKGLRFSEVGQLAGIHQTEWSWSPLLVDYDNDGWKDLTITNGFPKDITDKDFANYRSEVMNLASPGYLVDSIPIIKIPNYAFKNNGDLTFSDVSATWGLNIPSFSNGSAYADLDNDGDLDYVVNNISNPAFVFKNTLRDHASVKDNTHFLRIRLLGTPTNVDGIGARVSIYAKGQSQHHYHSVSRGYLSSVENIVHFGLGSIDQVDSIRVQWPNDSIQTVYSVKANQVLTIRYQDATFRQTNKATSVTPMLDNVSGTETISFLHQQQDIIDFNIQRTIPHKFSQFGPALSVGDINSDGLEDLFIGASPGHQSVFFIQQTNGSFVADTKRIKRDEVPAHEHTGALLFDLDNDNDLDLYTVLGGFDPATNEIHTRDALYINNGKGYFTSTAQLPAMSQSGGCVRAGDIDADGDLDLFVGGRVIPGQYPLTPKSYLLINDNGKLQDQTLALAPALATTGMVTDALFTDFDNDNQLDLVVIGELMPVVFYKNTNKHLEPITTPFSNLKGWWNSLAAADFDKDGDTDYVVGNAGLNHFYKPSLQQPVTVFAKDLDGNGSIEALTFCYSKMLDGSTRQCPIHFWDELNQQSPRFRRQFNKYKGYSTSTLETLLSENDRKDAFWLEGNYASSSYIKNEGNGKFTIEALPMEAQFSPVNGLIAQDITGDGFTDIVAIGNDYGNEVFIGRRDASTGLVLAGDGKGHFTSLPSSGTGFYVPGDAKALVNLHTPVKELIIASQNRDSLLVFSPRIGSTTYLTPDITDTYAILTDATGKQQKVEFYYGRGYLSQSSRQVAIPSTITEVKVYNSAGSSRIVKTTALAKKTK
jgi:enediyne biosynthesis protein E4